MTVTVRMQKFESMKYIIQNITKLHHNTENKYVLHGRIIINIIVSEWDLNGLPREGYVQWNIQRAFPFARAQTLFGVMQVFTLNAFSLSVNLGENLPQVRYMSQVIYGIPKTSAVIRCGLL